MQSLLNNALLEVDWKEPIVTPSNRMDRNLGPCSEATGLREHDVGLRALMRCALRNNLGRNIVQEVSVEVERRAVASATRRRCPGGG